MPRAAKSISVRSPRLAAQEEREKQDKKANRTYSLGTRSVPRMTIASNAAFQDAGMHVNRKGEVVSGSSDSESEKEASSSPSDEGAEVPSRRRNVAGRTARKTISKSVRKLAKGARKLAVEDRRKEQPPLKGGARKHEGTGALSEESDGAHSDVIELTESSSEEDIDKLLDAFDALDRSSSVLRKYRKLPFLLRNLRIGFESRCRMFGVPISPDDFPTKPVEVVYRYWFDDSDHADSDQSASVQERKYQEFLGCITAWVCPICELHKPFKNRHMLAYHLTQAHATVKVSWIESKLKNETLWRIGLIIPDVDESEEGSSEDSGDSDEERGREESR